MIAASNQLLWSMIGLLLTIGGTFLEASLTSFPWTWFQQGLHPLPLGVTYQIAGVLLVGCLGGQNAGALSQIAYTVMGLIWFPVFSQGGGISYIKLSQFGYILGFIPGAWICGYLAFRTRPRLEAISFSCICGILTVHLCGITYLTLGYFLKWQGQQTFSQLVQEMIKYSWHPLPGQFAIACAVTLVAFILRHLMFY